MHPSPSQNFEPLNRRFTTEEVEQFLSNVNRDENKQRNWIYNPHLHGDDETAWRSDIQEREGATAPWDRDVVKVKIAVDNTAKVSAGEKISF